MQGVGIQEYVRLLDSADIEQRRQAIIALGRSKQPAALKPLAEVYRRETDQELRELALRAGRYIKAQAGQQSESASQVTQTIDEPASPALVDAPRPVSERAERAARAAIEDALSFQTHGDIARAIRSVKKAYQHNPQLIKDTFFLGLATSLLNCDEADLVQALQDDHRASQAVRSSEERKAQVALAEHIKEVTSFRWTAVSLDLTLFSLLVTAGPLLLFFVLGESLRNWLALVGNGEAESNEVLIKLAEFVSALDATALLVLAATFLISGLLSLMVQCVAIHVSATRYLGGTGTLRYLMYRLISYFNRFMLIVFAITFVSIWLFISHGFPVGMLLVGGILALYSLFAFIKIGDRIGEAYKFSSGGGCISVIVASIVLVVANGAIAYLVYLVLGHVLSSIFPEFPL
nr:MAG: hypothetical protein DIU68_14065 [Chloroflexota bacterium]